MVFFVCLFHFVLIFWLLNAFHVPFLGNGIFLSPSLSLSLSLSLSTSSCEYHLIIRSKLFFILTDKFSTMEGQALGM